MSNENLNRSEIKLSEKMVFGKLTICSSFLNNRTMEEAIFKALSRIL